MLHTNCIKHQILYVNQSSLTVFSNPAGLEKLFSSSHLISSSSNQYLDEVVKVQKFLVIIHNKHWTKIKAIYCNYTNRFKRSYFITVPLWMDHNLLKMNMWCGCRAKLGTLFLGCCFFSLNHPPPPVPPSFLFLFLLISCPLFFLSPFSSPSLFSPSHLSHFLRSCPPPLFYLFSSNYTHSS